MRYDRSEELKAYKNEMFDTLRRDVPGFDKFLSGTISEIVSAAFDCGATAYSRVYDAKPKYGEMTKGM